MILVHSQLATFQVNFDFPFIESVNDILLRYQTAGFVQKWRKDGDTKQIKFLVKNSVGNIQFEGNNVSEIGDFVVPTVVWIGWIGAVVIFVSEIIWHKVQKRTELKRKLTFKKNIKLIDPSPEY